MNEKISVRRLTLSAMLLAVGLLLPFLTGQIQHIGNMLCRSWGISHRVSNWALSPVTVTELREVEGGYRPVYKFNGASYTINDLGSRWHMQLGLKVVF